MSTDTTPLSIDAVVMDVNQTISDTRPMAAAFECAGAPGHLADLWFGNVLRDGFALTAAGSSSTFDTIARGVLATTLNGVVDSVDVDRCIEQVMAAFAALEPHPDVAPGLTALARRGLRLATLGNGSASTARALMTRIGNDDVELFLSVDDAGAWKPSPRAYAYALDRLDTSAPASLMVAVHPWDLDGAARAGMRTAWLNRDRQPWPPHLREPDVQILRLGDLTDHLI